MEFAARDHQTLRRIVAMLVALAVLAERAGGRCVPVRFLVLFLLRRAERAAWGLVFGPAQARCPEAALGGRVDAEQLARRFRALAAALGALLRRACRFDGARLGGASTGHFQRGRARRGHRVSVTQGGSTLRLNDTS